MESFTPVIVSYHQFQVRAAADPYDNLDLYTMGDDLLQITGRAQLTVLTGPHTGPVEVRSRVLPSAPDGGLDGWHGAAECTTWCPDGQVAIGGLMGDAPDQLRTPVSQGPSLIRVRVLVRNRRLEDQPPDPLAPEQYEVAMWPVDEDTGFRSLQEDDMPSSMGPHVFARAAGWARPRLVAAVIPNPREAALRRAGLIAADPPVDRVRVRRLRTMRAAWALAFLRRPADYLGVAVDGDDLVLPAGDVEVRLRQIAAQEGFAARWRWAARPGSASAVTDHTESTAHIGFRAGDGEVANLSMLHEGVRASEAILLGFVWDYLLDHIEAVAAGGSVPDHPWKPYFDEIAARAEATRRSILAAEARRWGGTAPPQ